MNPEHIYRVFLWASFPLALATLIDLMFVTAPYGRHKRRGWGPSISNRLGWVVMESPSAILFFLLFLLGGAPKNLTVFTFLLMWEAHYIHRAFIYPFQLADGKKSMPVVIMLMAIVFNCGNAYINGGYLFAFSGGYPISWLSQPRTVIGVIIFISGFVINRWSDRILRSLRTHPGDDYQIPYGGLFRWVSCPNYLGETIEWIGWAIATWSLPGLSFAIWTFANLAPRARAHHTWYQAQFQDYPSRRKALIPGIW